LFVCSAYAVRMQCVCSAYAVRMQCACSPQQQGYHSPVPPMTTYTGGARDARAGATSAGCAAACSSQKVRARSQRCIRRSRVRCSGPRSTKLAGLRCRFDPRRRCKPRVSRWAHLWRCAVRSLARELEAVRSALRSRRTRTLRRRVRYASSAPSKLREEVVAARSCFRARRADRPRCLSALGGCRGGRHRATTRCSGRPSRRGTSHTRRVGRSERALGAFCGLLRAGTGQAQCERGGGRSGGSRRTAFEIHVGLHATSNHLTTSPGGRPVTSEKARGGVDSFSLDAAFEAAALECLRQNCTRVSCETPVTCRSIAA